MIRPQKYLILQVKSIGFINALKINQQNIAPCCNLIASNPLEGGKLPVDPKGEKS